MNTQRKYMQLDASMKKRLTRLRGKHCGRKTRMSVTFDLLTPLRDYFDPALDDVLIIDLLDKICNHAMVFHDVPGFKLKSCMVQGKEIL